MVTGSHLQMSGSGLELLNNTTTQFGIDSTGVNVGDPANEHVRITTSGVDIKDGTTTFGSFGSTITLAPDVSAATTDSVVITAGGVKIYDTSTDYIHISSDGLKVYDGDASNAVAQFGATTYVGLQANEHIKITNSSFEIKDGSTVFGSFGATTKIGDANNEHVEINTSTIDVKDGGTTLSSFGSTTTIGQTSGRHISIDSTDVRVKQGSTVKSIFGASSITLGHNSTSDEHIIIDSDGLNVKDGSTSLAQFGSTVRVGPDANSKSRVEISSGAVQIINKDSNGDETTMLNFKSDGDIESGEFLIERSRLFGAGNDGTVVLEHDDCSVSAASAAC